MHINKARSNGKEENRINGVIKVAVWKQKPNLCLSSLNVLMSYNECLINHCSLNYSVGTKFTTDENIIESQDPSKCFHKKKLYSRPSLLFVCGASYGLL